MRTISLFFLSIIFTTQIACSPSSVTERAVVYQPVSTDTVVAQSQYTLTRGFTGVVEPAQTANMAFEFGGTLHSVLVSEGDRVEEGQLLAKLDTALLSIEHRQLKAQLTEAEANLRLALANVKRQSALENDGYASRQRRDELEANRDALRANIDQLKAALDGNQVRQEKSALHAPFAGVISERFLAQGSAAGPGTAVLRLLETGRLEAHVGVPLRLAKDISPGEQVQLKIAEQTLMGEVLAVGSELKARSNAVMIRVGISDVSNIAGNVVELQLEDKIEASGFIVPESALSASLRGLWRIYVLKSEGKNLYRVEARDLQLRFSGETEAYVTGGLHDGDTIVVDGVHKIVPGQIVKLGTQG